MNVLVADDDRLSRELLRKIVESDSTYRVLLAEDGEEAWKTLCDEGNPIDIAMLDIHMPRVDGLAVIERMRAIPTLKNIPVILCTAAADRSTVAKASTLSVAHYVVKPYAKDVILAKLQTVRQEITRNSFENLGEVLHRLSIDDETYRALASALLKEIGAWLQTTRFTTDLGRFVRLSERAAGLRGACELFGLPSLVHKLGEIEFTLLSDSAASKGQQSPLVMGQLAPIFETLEREIKRVQRHLGLAS